MASFREVLVIDDDDNDHDGDIEILEFSKFKPSYHLSFSSPVPGTSECYQILHNSCLSS